MAEPAQEFVFTKEDEEDDRHPSKSYHIQRECEKINKKNDLYFDNLSIQLEHISSNLEKLNEIYAELMDMNEHAELTQEFKHICERSELIKTSLDKNIESIDIENRKRLKEIMNTFNKIIKKKEETLSNYFTTTKLMEDVQQDSFEIIGGRRKKNIKNTKTKRTRREKIGKIGIKEKKHSRRNNRQK